MARGDEGPLLLKKEKDLICFELFGFRVEFLSRFPPLLLLFSFPFFFSETPRLGRCFVWSAAASWFPLSD